MSTEPKTESDGGSNFDLVPVARKTQAIATALWQKPSVRYGVVPGLVIAAVGIGAWAHLRQTKVTNPELRQPPSESE